MADKYLRDVDVKVIGSGNEDFVSGQTDLRGVFVADGIRGGATVIAQAGPGRYAFYRAKETLIAATLARARRRSRSRRKPLRRKAVRSAAVSLGESPAAEKIKEALDSPTEFDFTEAPLEEVVDYLKKRHKIEIQIDKRVLEDVGITTETPVTVACQGGQSAFGAAIDART